MSKEKKDLLFFGYGLGVIAAVFGVGSVIKHGWKTPGIILLLCSLIFIVVSVLDWKALKPGYQGWMKVAHLFGCVVTAVILSIVFFLIFTPIGIFLRLTGRDHLQRHFLKDANSYWEKRDKTIFQQARYHQQY
jgi:hypothetical protein